MESDGRFIAKDPSVGAKTAKETGFRVDENGVPLDIIAKQRENEKVKNNTASDDITNDPMFAEMFGHAGTKPKDPFSQGGNEDHWISGTPAPIKKEEPVAKKSDDIPLENQMVPTNDPNDISNDPKLKEMLRSMEETNESDSSDSHTDTTE